MVSSGSCSWLGTIFLATDSAAIAAAAVSEVIDGFEVLMLREDLQTTVAMNYHSSPHTD